MEATIIFKNSQRITAEQNGNCFIMNEAPVFPADLSEVRVVNEEGERVLQYVIIQEAASIDGRFWFCFVEESATDRRLREQEEKSVFIEDCLMEMSEEVYK